jgi:hypothetical protein
MAKWSLTDRTLKALKPAPKRKSVDLWDAIVPGLSVRVQKKLPALASGKLFVKAIGLALNCRRRPRRQ